MTRWRHALLGIGALGVIACADLADGPTDAASLEFEPFAFPSVEIGDSLRDTTGVARPIRAIARTLGGAEIPEAPLRYAARESLVVIDTLTGHLVPDTSLSPGQINLIARFASSLQIAARIPTTRGPDTVARTDTASLVTSPDAIGPTAIDRNSVAFSVQVQGRDRSGTRVNVEHWLVRFAVVSPANPRNDTTAAVFLIREDNARPSSLDTTANNGLASRRIRVRPDLFPRPGLTVDTVVVEAAVMRRGAPVPGAPVRIRIPVRRP
jgi:hypothetical protein